MYCEEEFLDTIGGGTPLSREFCTEASMEGSGREGEGRRRSRGEVLCVGRHKSLRGGTPV